MYAKIVTDNNVVRLIGPLTVKTVPQLFKQGITFQHVEQLDLKDVGKIDSAGLSLLIYWHNIAKKRSFHLQYKNVPHSLIELAALCSVEFLFIDKISETN